MPTTYKFISIVMCDDARREDNGKEILIGTYSGSMLVPAVPYVLPSFAMRFEIIPIRTEYRKVIALLKNPKNEDVFRLEGALAVARPNIQASFFYRASPVLLATTGEYKVFLGMDEDPEEVGSLTITQGHSVPAPPLPIVS
jgi:hypothetical protein